ncbi:MAG: MBL fold metallo-hydrolase [Rhizobiaceae bacterium]
MKITCLGTGCPEPNPRRASSGYLVEVGKDVILMDCGGGVFDRLIQSGRKPSDITHLFFTHLHTDHMMDYARLVHAAWDEGGAAMKVIGPAPISKITDKLFGRDGVFATDLAARTELKGSQEVWLERGGTLPRPWPQPEILEVEPGFSYSGDGWSLYSCNAPHAQPLLTCMAFRLEAAGKSVVYTGDSALCDEVEQLAQNTDLLIHWCYRMSGDVTNEFIRKMSPDPIEIACLATRCAVGQVLVTHLRASMDTDDGRRQILAELAANFSGVSGIAEDLLQIEI